MRRLARRDFHVFTESTLGKVILAVIGDARGALHQIPNVYEKVAPGDQRVVVENLPDGRVRLDFLPNLGVYAYQLGQLEEIVAHFGARPTTDVFLGPDDLCRFEIRLG